MKTLRRGSGQTTTRNGRERAQRILGRIEREVHRVTIFYKEIEKRGVHSPVDTDTRGGGGEGEYRGGGGGGGGGWVYYTQLGVKAWGGKRCLGISSEGGAGDIWHGICWTGRETEEEKESRSE